MSKVKHINLPIKLDEFDYTEIQNSVELNTQ